MRVLFSSPCRIYAVTVSSRVTAGKQETLCAQIHGLTGPVRMVIGLTEGSVTILDEQVNEDFYRCLNFQVRSKKSTKELVNTQTPTLHTSSFMWGIVQDEWGPIRP